MKTPTGERIYSSHLILTSALDAGEWSESRPGRDLPPGKDAANMLRIQNWKAAARDKEKWRKKVWEAMARKWAEVLVHPAPKCITMEK